MVPPMRALPWHLLSLAGLLVGACSPNTPLYVPMPDAAPSSQPWGIDGGDYPSTNVGGKPRKGAVPGQTFPNLNLEGIRSLDSIDTATMVSMAEFYDPAGERYDLLHVMGIFFWCPHCNNETNDLMKIAAWRASSRVAVIQIAMEGYGSASPGWNELQRWVRDHKCDFPVVVDGQGEALGQYFDVGSVPLNIVVNPRTMEVLAVDVGEVGDVQSYEQRFLALP
jgi:hypothetical protein